MNSFKTGLLLASLTALFMGLGFAIAGAGGAIVALVIAGGMNLLAWWNADRMVLSMNGARAVGPDAAPELFALVEELAGRAGLPMPAVFVMESDQPNAFATGRDPRHAAVAVTTGLLQRLNRDELAGVLAHELAHIKNRDTLTMTVTATIAGAIGMLGNFALFFGGGLGDRDGERANPLALVAMMVLAPFAAMLVQMAISRTREYSADRTGAEICGQPRALAAALAKLHKSAATIDNPVAERNPSLAHLFIVNPLSGARMDNLFSTHPATENRIAALEALAASGAPARNRAQPARPLVAGGRRSALDPNRAR